MLSYDPLKSHEVGKGAFALKLRFSHFVRLQDDFISKITDCK